MNGLHIQVSKEEFQGKPPEERDWILYEAVSQINGQGCRYGRTRWKKVFTFGGFMGLAGGFLAGALKRVFT